MPHNPQIDQEQEAMAIRTKLDNLSATVKKLAEILKNTASETSLSLIEGQMVNKLKALGGQISSLKSLEGSEGETFASFLKDMFNIINSMGKLTKENIEAHKEHLTLIFKELKLLEEEAYDLLKVTIAMDEKKKTPGFESFGGLLQKLIDAIQEKRHIIMRQVE